ncbi:protease [Streptomyces lunaelactis]|uniref:Protease n=2 Tax=Streptomyces lunaelactis TaxID=1535768 RepID=A0A2R4TFI4_9ACTN|nr:protease [Streptomyces lunaelactis]NUK85469.1 S8 family peptidase [Streptomyces lunaelactis]
MAGDESPSAVPMAPASPQAAPSAGQSDALIVGYKSKAAGARSDTAVREDTQAVAAQTDEKLSFDRRLGTGTVLVDLGEKQPAKDVAEVMDQFRADPDVAFVVPDRTVQAAAIAAPSNPNDPRLGEQWELTEAQAGMNVRDAWRTSTGRGVTVAVLDTGIAAHSDLAANTVAGYDFITDAFTAKDGGGRDNDASDPGDASKQGECKDPLGNPLPAAPSSWHGTHVAGTVAAVADNGKGVVGVAHGARVQPVRVLGRCGGSTSDIIDAITWASGGAVPGVPANGTPAQVINMSLGGGGACDPATQGAIDGAVQRGTTVVVAAGNESSDAANSSPASCNNVITVAATNRAGDKAGYSNFGNAVDISAPGGETSPNSADGILSTLNSGTDAPAAESFAFYQGTSMAAPHIAGLAALLKAARPALAPAEIERAIKDNARPLPGACAGGCGSGLADAARTVASAAGGAAPAEDPASPPAEDD